MTTRIGDFVARAMHRINGRVSESAPLNAESPCRTGLGADVDRLVAGSQTLTQHIKTARNGGWTIAYGKPEEGTYCEHESSSIVIDSSSQGDPKKVVQALAHEAGHALYDMGPILPARGRTMAQFVHDNSMQEFKSEGEATLVNCQVRNEIIATMGVDIGLNGNQPQRFQEVFDKYPDPKDRDQARTELGALIADGAHPDASPGETYRQFYGRSWEIMYVDLRVRPELLDQYNEPVSKPRIAAAAAKRGR